MFVYYTNAVSCQCLWLMHPKIQHTADQKWHLEVLSVHFFLVITPKQNCTTIITIVFTYLLICGAGDHSQPNMVFIFQSVI